MEKTVPGVPCTPSINLQLFVAHLKRMLCPNTGTKTGLPASSIWPCRCLSSRDCSMAVCCALPCFKARSAHALLGDLAGEACLLGEAGTTVAGSPGNHTSEQAATVRQAGSHRLLKRRLVLQPSATAALQKPSGPLTIEANGSFSWPRGWHKGGRNGLGP